MLLDLSRELCDFDDVILKDTTSEGKLVNATWKRTIVNSVLRPNTIDDGEMKLKKFELARKAYSHDEFEFDEEEIKLIQDCIYKTQSPIVCGLWNELINPMRQIN